MVKGVQTDKDCSLKKVTQLMKKKMIGACLNRAESQVFIWYCFHRGSVATGLKSVPDMAETVTFVIKHDQK